MADITPVTREEFYLAKAGGQDVPVPSAVTREEHYLEKLSNDNVVVPSPVTRREKFLYFACGGDVTLPSEDKMTRLERLIAKAGGMDVITPTAITRLEKFWANVEGGWRIAELTGTLPITFRSNGTALINYRIFGTADGAGVQTEQHGYKIPLTVSGTETKTTDVYIGDTKLMAGDYIDYKTGKIYKAKRIHEDTVTIDGIEWDILDYDHDEVYKADGTRAKHTVTIQTHDIINELQYSARQAVFAFPNGLAAGTYHFTVGAHPWVDGDIGKVLTLTLANAIPTGGQLVFNGVYNQTLVGTTISAFALPTSTTAAETVTMIEGNTGTDLGTIQRSKTDAINSIDRALLGSNNWLESTMRQYLNSDKAAGSVWTPQSVFDRPPTWAATTAGFLHGIDPDFVAVLGNVKKKTGLNTISDGGGTATHDEKVFLLSRSEVFMGDEYAGGEDTPYAYYKNYSDNQSASTGADKNRIKYRADAAKYWWLRSPYAGYANHVWLVHPSGAWYVSNATSALGVAPACCIVLDDMDDWVKQTFYTENTVDLPAIETFKGENTLDSTETLGEVTIKGKIKEA